MWDKLVTTPRCICAHRAEAKGDEEHVNEQQEIEIEAGRIGGGRRAGADLVAWRLTLSCALALASSSAPPHTAPPRRRPASLLPRRQQRRRDFASPCRIPPSPPPARSRRRCSASSRRVVPGRSSYCVDQIQKLRPSAATGAASGKR